MKNNTSKPTTEMSDSKIELTTKIATYVEILDITLQKLKETLADLNEVTEE